MFILKDILNQNELRILRAVYETGPVSRVRVAKGLNLTRAAVSVNIKRLQELGLIIEVGKGNSGERRGRREVLLSVNRQFGYIISMHFALNEVTFGIVNLGGQVMALQKQQYPKSGDRQEILSSLTDGIKQMLADHKIDTEKVFGAGIAIPGIISYPAGELGEMTLPGWEGFNIREYFMKALDCEVFVDNDVKALTLGEFQFGTSRTVSSLVCLWMDNGIGAGFMIEGRLIRGATSSAGEIGFNEFFIEPSVKQSIVINDQPKYWGDVLSLTNIRRSIERGIEEGWSTSLNGNAEIEEIAAAVANGDPLAEYIIEIIGKLVGTVCRNLIYTLNPQTLILNGPLFNKLPVLTDEVRRHMKLGNLKLPFEAVELTNSRLGDNSIIVGCAALVLEHLFKFSEQKSMHSHSNTITELLA